MDRQVAASDTLTLAYTGTAVKDTAGNALAVFTGKPIVNGVAGEVTVTITDTLDELNKGGSHTFHAEGGGSKGVIWTVTGKDESQSTVSLAQGTIITSTTGELTVDAAETAAVLTITATSVVDSTKSASIEITLVGADVPLVTAVVVSVQGGGTATVTKGQTLQLSAAVTAVNGASQEVTWSIAEQHATGTTISNTGLLTVAADETNAVLTAQAASKQADFGNVRGQLVITITSPDTPSVSSVWLSGSMANNWTFPGVLMTKEGTVFKWEGLVGVDASFRFSLEDTSGWDDDKARGERYQPAEDNTTLTDDIAAAAIYIARNTGDENAWKITSAGSYRIVFDPSAHTVTVTKLTSSVDTGANITLSITDAGAGLTLIKGSEAVIGGSIGTISKTSGESITIQATTSGYTYEWVINGNYAGKTSGDSITLNAVEFPLGNSTLTLIAKDSSNDKTWSFDKPMSFTVVK
ncbi:MAG: hypothetical protein LBI40_03410 [Treponema sp.]|nr:hypothetical protein [Treponema sp.]